MFRNKITLHNSTQAQNDPPLYAIYKDFSGGINTRVHPRDIRENQTIALTNWDIGTPATLYKTLGSVQIGSLASIGTSVLGLHNFDIQGGTDQLLKYTENNKLYKWEGSGNWVDLSSHSSFSSLMSGAELVGFISAKESGLTPDDIAVFYNGRNNVIRLTSDGNLQDLGDTNTSPPLTDVMCWYGNRIWGLKDDLLYFSDAYDSDYSGAFDRTTNIFRVPVGAEMGLAPTRDLGIVCLGKNAIWALAPSVVPAATDQPQPLLTGMGCVSKGGWAMVGDDIFFFSQDGLRALKRTVQDKLQLGADYQVSYLMKTDFEGINWAYISRLTMRYFDNNLFIGIPTGANTFDTWIYYPTTQGFTKKDGLSPRCWARYKVSGEERLYYGLHGRNKVFQAWTGYTDEGTNTTNGTTQTATLETRAEDFQQPLVWKVGGEIEIEATSATGNLNVYARVDEGNYTLLGVMALTSPTAPTLPIDLPFTLSDSFIVREKFHLDSFGRFRIIQVKIEHTEANTEDIKIYNINITTFPEEYRNED